MELLEHTHSPLAAEIQLAWPPPPPHVELSGTEVQVWASWLLRPDYDYAAGLATLSAAERERSGLFQFERDRKNFIARRALVRGILGHYLNLEPSCVALQTEERGKPRLASPEGDASGRLHFNFSHSRNLGLLAVSRSSPVGVDVERIRPMPEMEETAANFCSVLENAQFHAAPPEQKLEVFFNIWTRKEAFLKATGEGIAGALAELDCSVAPAPWEFHPLSPAAGFAGTLAVTRGLTAPECWQWPGF